jgi:hypothetical protein
MAASCGLVTGPGSRVAAVWTSRAADRSRSCSRSSAGAVTSSARRALMAWVRERMAVWWATRSDRIISTWPLPALGGRLPVRPARPWPPRPRPGIASALEASGLAVGPVDLQHRLVVGGEEAGQPGAVAAGAFHPPGDGRTEPPGPGQQLSVAGRGGRDLQGVQLAAELVGGVGDVDVQVGIDPDRQLGHGGVWDAGDGRLLSSTGQGWHARRPGGQHCEESGRQARIRSRSSGWRAVVAAARADRSISRHQAGG